MLTQDQVREHIVKRLGVDMVVVLETGEKGFMERNKAYVLREVEGQEEPEKVLLQDDDYLVVKFDKNTINRINNTYRALLKSRGISDLSDITVNHPAVQKVMRKQKIKRNDEEGVYAAIVQVRSEVEPYITTTFFQSAIFALVAPSLFTKIDPRQIEYKIDVHVPTEYWTSMELASILQKEEEVDPFDKDLFNIFESATGFRPRINERNQAEFMVAVVTTIAKEYPKFMEKITPVVTDILASYALIMEDEEYDDLSFLDKRLDDIIN